MTNAVHVFNACISALHQTHLIANDSVLVLYLTDEEKASIPVEQLQSKDYSCEIESSAANLPFDCRFFTKPDMAISRLDETVYSVPLLSEFSFTPEIMAYFLQGNSSSLFAGSLESLTADLSLHAKKRGSDSECLYTSVKLQYLNFMLSGYDESFLRAIAQNRQSEFQMLLPWLNHFTSKFQSCDEEEKFRTLIDQMHVLLNNFDKLHTYEFTKYELLLRMAGDFSPITNHFNDSP